MVCEGNAVREMVLLTKGVVSCTVHICMSKSYMKCSFVQ